MLCPFGADFPDWIKLDLLPDQITQQLAATGTGEVKGIEARPE
ncbi:MULTISPECIES: hypothetical protein [unclassified Paenibacillus]|nr:MULTISPECIES: hypothetical protein [unclassified Paenibacillus]EGL16012.1 hypothetical protein HMPREF9413_0119 [Paenibacillus sp. HGF7]